VLVFVLPLLVLFVTRWVCLALKRGEEIEAEQERAEEEARAAAREEARSAGARAGPA